jgi:hypothetical protein
VLQFVPSPKRSTPFSRTNGDVTKGKWEQKRLWRFVPKRRATSKLCLLQRSEWQLDGGIKYRMLQKELYNSIPNVTAWRVLRKYLHLKVYKLSSVQDVQKHETRLRSSSVFVRCSVLSGYGQSFVNPCQFIIHQWSRPQIQRSGFESQSYQIFWEVVGLERGPLSLVSTTEESTEWYV